MTPPTLADYDRQLAEIFSEIRHRSRVLAAAEVVCAEARRLVQMEVLDDVALICALGQFDAIKALRGGR